VEASRKVIEYSAEVLPLEEWIGCHAEVSGGYMAAYQPDQHWLDGRPSLSGRLFSDVKVDDHHMPLAVVRLDDQLDLPPRRGRLQKLAGKANRGDPLRGGSEIGVGRVLDPSAAFARFDIHLGLYHIDHILTYIVPVVFLNSSHHFRGLRSRHGFEHGANCQAL